MKAQKIILIDKDGTELDFATDAKSWGGALAAAGEQAAKIGCDAAIKETDTGRVRTFTIRPFRLN